MTLTEFSEAKLQAVETANLVNAKKFMRVCALASGVLVIPHASLPISGEYQGYTRTTSDTFRTVRVTRSTQETRPRLEAKTELARRLLALREEAIRNGMALLSQDEILAEIQRRRGEVG
jgi:hypothetical protein